MSQTGIALPTAPGGEKRTLTPVGAAATMAAALALLLLPEPLSPALPLVAFGIGGFVTAAIYYRDLLSPIGVFLMAWFVPLGVSQLYLSRLQHRFDAKTWIVVLGSAAAF